MDDFPDDRLRLIFTCCHPSLAPEARVALTLRSLGGLTTPEIARAFLVPEPTMAQRIVRAKRKIRDAGIPYVVPEAHELPERLASVLAVLYLVFNEGYAASSGDSLVRRDLCAEAIRLGGLLAALMPDEAEVLGLAALMMLQDSRRDARVDAAGGMVLLEDQDRGQWDRPQIAGRARPVRARAGAGARGQVRAAGRDRRRARPGSGRRRTPTGRGSHRSTASWAGSTPPPWSRSTARWRWRCPRVRRPASSSRTRWPRTWTATRRSTRPERSCSIAWGVRRTRRLPTRARWSWPPTRCSGSSFRGGCAGSRGRCLIPRSRAAPRQRVWLGKGVNHRHAVPGLPPHGWQRRASALTSPRPAARRSPAAPRQGRRPPSAAPRAPAAAPPPAGSSGPPWRRPPARGGAAPRARRAPGR